MAGSLTHGRIARILLADSSSRWDAARMQPAWFLFGANAPDFGSYPGGHAIVSDCAHYVRPADLVRTMLAFADSEAQRAFALGWLTHVVADAILHPVVNREAGRRLFVDRAVPFVEDPAMHIRVEFGFDAFAGDPRLDPCPRIDRGHLDSIATMLSQTYAASYGRAFAEAWFVQSCSALNRFAPWMLWLARLHRRSHRSRYSLAGCTVDTVRRSLVFARMDSRIIAHADPLFPSAQYTQEMESGIVRTCEECRRHVDSEIVHLENRNLDTGERANDNDPYPLAVSTRARLDQLPNATP